MGKEKLLFPSLEGARFERLADEVKELDEGGCTGFHLDIGEVPPLGLRDIALIRSLTKKPLDCHLYQVTNHYVIDCMADVGVNIVYVVPGMDPNAMDSLEYAVSKGMEPASTLLWGDHIEDYEEFCGKIDYLMLNNYYPGRMPEDPAFKDIREKALYVKEYRDSHGYKFKILIDGKVTPELVKWGTENGVDGYAMGTNVIFKQNRPYGEILKELIEM